MEWEKRKSSWADREVAASYDARRFGTALERLKGRNDVRRLLRLLSSCEGARSVVDLPVGTGRLVGGFAEAGYDVVGMDFAREMMAASPAVDHDRFLGFVQGDAEQIPLGTDAVDVVISIRFLFHVRDADVRRRILTEFARVSSGWVIGQVRLRGTLKHTLRFLRSRVGLARRYRPAQSHADIAAELSEAGLELVRLAPVSRLFSDKAFFLARSSAVT